jgi:CRP-like cAMP-binding protein
MDDKPNLLERLRTVKHFQDLSLADLQLIVNSGQVRRFKAGEMIFIGGEPCSGMFVLIKGRVHLCNLGPQGQENIIAVVEPVIMFNEVAVVDGGPNPLSAIAVEDCILWQIGYRSFQELLEKIPQIGLSLLKVLAARNRQMIVRYEDLSFRSVVARTAKLILDVSEGGRKPVNRRKCSIGEMANRIATVPEAISRSLRVLRNQGLIKVSRTEIEVIHPENLARMAQIQAVLSGD